MALAKLNQIKQKLGEDEPLIRNISEDNLRRSANLRNLILDSDI